MVVHVQVVGRGGEETQDIVEDKDGVEAVVRDAREPGEVTLKRKEKREYEYAFLKSVCCAINKCEYWDFGV